MPPTRQSQLVLPSVSRARYFLDSCFRSNSNAVPAKVTGARKFIYYLCHRATVIPNERGRTTTKEKCRQPRCVDIGMTLSQALLLSLEAATLWLIRFADVPSTSNMIRFNQRLIMLDGTFLTKDRSSLDRRTCGESILRGNSRR